MSTILVTGIEPFDGETLNPSWKAARALDGEESDPELVLCLGQAGGRADVTLERVAINVVDARIPDNAVYVPYLPEMAVRHPGTPSLALATLTQAIRIMAATAMNVRRDIKLGAGREH